MSEPLPAPYPRNDIGPLCPFTIRCNEIDKAATLLSNPDMFAQAAKGDRVLDPEADFRSEAHAFYEKPDEPYIRHFTEEGGCPAFRGKLNAGDTSNVLCALVDMQLHVYCQLKFCEKGRKVYCPIWLARSQQLNEPKEEDDETEG